MSDEQDKVPGADPQEEEHVPVSMPPDKAPNHAKQVWKGIGLLALLHLLLIPMPIAYFFISVAQVVYLIPALIICRKNRGIVQGLLIGAGVTFLVNAACFGIVMGGGNL